MVQGGGGVCQFWFSCACDELSLMCCSKVGSLRCSYSREPKNYVSGLVIDCLQWGATGCSRRSLRHIFRVSISPVRMDSSFTDSSVWSLTMLCTGCNCLQGDKLTLFPEECLMVILWNCCFWQHFTTHFHLVDPASSHMLVSKIKPCMSEFKLIFGETANGSLYQL